MDYKHTPDMGEISGYSKQDAIGAEYEEVCQQMLQLGCEYINAHPDEEVAYGDLDGVIGFYKPNNDFTQQMMDHIVTTVVVERGPEKEPSSVMCHMVLKRCMVVAAVGWDEYARLCREVEKEDGDATTGEGTGEG